MKTQQVMLWSLAGLLTITTSCQKQPNASFKTDKSTYNAGEIVHLTNTSTDADHYLWTLPLGSLPTTLTSKDVDYTLAITTPDETLTFKLETFSKNGKKKDAAMQTITVKAIPVNQKFLGTYSVVDNYTSDNCGSGTDYYSMTITAGSSSTLVNISNYIGLFNSITATVSGSTITINSQLNKTDKNGTVWDLCDIGTCTGTINGNTLSFSYSIDDISYGNTCGAGSGTLTANK